MALDVVAVLKIPHAVLTSALPAGPPESPGSIRCADGSAVPVRALGTIATLFFSAIPFASEPEEIGIALRMQLGDLLDRHDDARGIYAFPSVAKPTATEYGALITEMGELGIWVPLVAKDAVHPAAGEGLAASLLELQSALPQELLAQLQSAMASGDPAQIDSLGASVDAILATQGDLIQKLQDSIAGAFGGVGGGFAMPPEGFTPEMLEEARAEIEAFARTNPELLDELQKQSAGAIAAQPADPRAKKP